jgi:exopolysaccharide biosynthesis polyprenyl glycosylphosphotransferase
MSTHISQVPASSVDSVAAPLARPVRLPRDYFLHRVLAGADAVGLLAAVGIATYFAHGTRWTTQFGWSVLLLPVWILVFKAYGLYDRDGKRVSHSTLDDVPWIFHALLAGSLGLWLLEKAAPAVHQRFPLFALFVGAALVCVTAARVGARAIAARAIEGERVLFVGSGDMARLLLDKINGHREYGLQVIGYVDADARHEDMPLPWLGRLTELERVCREGGIERLFVASPNVAEPALAELVRVAATQRIRVSLLPQLSDVLGPSVTLDDVEGVTVLGLNPPTLSPSSRLLKRALDVTMSLLVLALSLPVCAAIAILIATTSPGPVLYRQERVGLGGRRFRICKFRTMVVDAEARAAELKKLSAHPAWLLLEHDPRVTRVGRILRKLSLDELPQLWNVVRGDMSLVGPRPMPPDVDGQISGWGRRRLDLMPGITGLWQVLGRTSIAFEEMLKLDYIYVTNWSLWYDIRLLVQTLPAVIRQRGAN